MKSPASMALLVGFGSLVFLFVALGAGAMRRTEEMHRLMTAAQEAHEEVDKALRDLPAGIHLTGTVVRDYLLDPSRSAAQEYKELLAREQKSMELHMTQLSALRAEQRDMVERLQREIQAYSDSLDPMLSWSPEDRVANGYWFLRSNVIPRRHAIIKLTGELRSLNDQTLAFERKSVDAGRVALQHFIRDFLLICVEGGSLIVAALTTWRVALLNRRERQARERAEEAEREQHRLAMRVVAAQEEERKRISLELHDAVGQLASALGMELGRLESYVLAPPEQFHAKVAEVKEMNSEVVRALKEIASGLRPAMLDQLGLGAAVRSHAREFSRRTGVAAEVRLEGELEAVPEPHRTCIYRIVQEALNNCARHAGARRAVISLSGAQDSVSLTVEDDGAGFDVRKKSKNGLGLVGIAERVRDLSGNLKISSTPGKGTVLEVLLPMKEVPAAL